MPPSVAVHSETPTLDVQKIRQDFPILARKINGKNLVYLDSAATSQKPRSVIERVSWFYESVNANVHRGIHTLAEEATAAFEAAREAVAAFVNAREAAEIVFTRNATEAINLVAYSWCSENLRPGDEILTTEMEHHANLVPWQLAARRTGATLRVLPVTDEGELRLDLLPQYLTAKTKLFAFTHVSNVLGTINPAAELAQAARNVGAATLLDACQSVTHSVVDVQALDCDFLVFSGHKMCGPAGIGCLYGRRELLELMPPFLAGGEMVRDVEYQHTVFNEIPWKFEAGTPAFADAAGLQAAIEYLVGIGLARVGAHARDVAAYALQRLREIPRISVVGPEERAALVSFTLDNIHPHDIAQVLDDEAIAVRAGHHCAHPLHKRLGLAATVRASFYLYNTREEVDALIAGLDRVRAIFHV